MRIDKVVQRLKNLRKQRYLKLNYSGRYAFVGIGNHSLHNLYPVLNHLRVDLRYIVTRSRRNASMINRNFSDDIIATTDFDTVLKDDNISGVFICADPKAHFELTKKSLLAGKNVFVEKPPCTTQEELQELMTIEENAKAICMVGLQKRYAPINQMLKKKIGKTSSYNYKFLTGTYPEGDPFLDLFIHPIDLVQYLFGKGKAISVIKRQAKNELTCFVQLTHENQTIGTIELSTAYAWHNAQEELIINTSSGVYTAYNTEELVWDPKMGTLLNIPKEKLMSKPPSRTILYKRNNFNPILINNQIYTSGYYTEVKNFIETCEGISTHNYSPIKDMTDAYSLLFQLKQTPDV